MRRAVAVLALLALATGCTVGPSYERPPVAAPNALFGPPDSRSLADLAWWDVFQDPVLRDLVRRALVEGYDVRIAAARVEEASALYGIARSAAFPQLDVAASAARGRLPEVVVEDGKTHDAFVASVSVGWEIDLWGRVRKLNEAGRARYLASEDARRGVVLSIVSEVASAYFELRELDAELDNAKRTRDAFQETFDLFRRRLEGGAASALETSRAEAELASVSAEIPSLERSIAAKENQIDFLLGALPGPVPRGATLEDQPIPPEIPAGLPSSLLERRPDLLQSEQELVAATADVGVARASYFPTISLTGSYGGASPDLSNLLGADRAWSIGAGLLAPIFHGGRIRAEYRASLARLDQAKLGYERDVNRALAEVATALVVLQKQGAIEVERSRAVAANETAVRLVRLRYESGLSAYFEVLDSLKQLFESQNQLAESRRDRLVALAALYEALGGGWQTEATGGI